MASYTLTATIPLGFDDALAATREALATQGFGVLTEIDLAGTLHEKVGVEMAPQVILGACRPQLAYQAIQEDNSIATVLPCNVVVRADGPDSSIVEAFDPDAMLGLADNPALDTVAADAKERLNAALEALGGTAEIPQH